MELVPGHTLADRIARGPLPIDEAIEVFSEIARGLEAAHAKGVVHRDLKPANVKIADGASTSSGGRSASGAVKILDFGLAKALAPEAELKGGVALSESPTLTQAATLRGEILGTAAYMSPEQARGRAVDERADIWAFGVCLYEALTGSLPFAAEDAVATLAKVIETAPSFDALPAATPASIRRLLRRCLVKRPENRLQSIGDARLELDEALAANASDGSAPAADGDRVRRSARRGALVLAAVAALVTGLVVGLALVGSARGRRIRRHRSDSWSRPTASRTSISLRETPWRSRRRATSWCFRRSVRASRSSGAAGSTGWTRKRSRAPRAPSLPPTPRTVSGSPSVLTSR